MGGLFRRPNAFDGKRRMRGGMRARLLVLPAILFFLSGFGGTAPQMLMGLIAGGLILGASWMTREGLKAEIAYDQRALARRPALPRKTFGAALTGLGLVAGGLMNGQIVFAAIFGLIGAGLHVAAFGTDPWRSKGEDVDRVSRAVTEAEGHLAAMQAAIAPLSDRALNSHLARVSATARTLLGQVEASPRLLPLIRKDTAVYLRAARDASQKFADLQRGHPDSGARQDYIAMLVDLETTLAARSAQARLGDRTDLDVEIGVLRDRLTRE
ncbi:5-bromo-4-chloroindolyl phosphate hydrolysis family protein [Falsirhodobacter halotolerans]|uniref:5-bromo-4-chloroindolyl phosphate hydrolysis family protein n=1 Tax=Falsirhodobacter halotolerans TaxID=1146892 RepID=UPI001FD11E8F|nr:5-bromo-4-chloroindolyl phosphate hydrolysis family protein [Falsirhodobacter halotolerans]MCJ8140278.1 5-bromo-4-chloroindolyl phosphate hydrolysis family protein [Falsirhodobacter halotolerans]